MTSRGRSPLVRRIRAQSKQSKAKQNKTALLLGLVLGLLCALACSPTDKPGRSEGDDAGTDAGVQDGQAVDSADAVETQQGADVDDPKTATDSHERRDARRAGYFAAPTPMDRIGARRRQKRRFNLMG